MFGDEDGPSLRVCCGPRCGAEPGQRAIYAAVETASGDVTVLPTMCQGHCGAGVTIVLPDGEIRKIREARETVAVLAGTIR